MAEALLRHQITPGSSATPNASGHSPAGPEGGAGVGVGGSVGAEVGDGGAEVAVRVGVVSGVEDADGVAVGGAGVPVGVGETINAIRAGCSKLRSGLRSCRLPSPRASRLRTKGEA